MPLCRYTPDELLDKYRQIRDSVAVEAFFRRPAHKKTQELWCAAHFGRGYEHSFEPCWIHVSDEDEQTDTDFHFELPNGLHPFQITEVQSPDRRRGDEYRRGAATDYSLADYDRGDVEGPSWVRERLAAKLQRYGDASALNLLVYTNFPARSQEYSAFAEETRNLSTQFASVWLLNGNALCCIKESPALAFVEGWVIVPESLGHDEP